MPVSRDEFEKGKVKDPLEEIVADFLKKNKDIGAFTDTEISENIGIKDLDFNEDWKTNLVRLVGWFGFKSALDRLVKEGRINLTMSY